MADNTFIKDPNAVLDYTVNWEAWLNGDTISTSTWVVPAGLTKDSSENTDSTTTIWLSTGTVGKTYYIVNSIVTAAGRKEDKTLEIICKQK